LRIKKSIIYPQELNVKSVKHETDHEEIARKSIETTLNLTIKCCGLFIDSEISFLDASPDGLIEEDEIVEIKCPFDARFLTPEDAIARNISNLQSLYKNKDEKMNRNFIYIIIKYKDNYTLATVLHIRIMDTIRIKNGNNFTR